MTWLTDKQLAALTRRTQPAAQIRVLRAAGIAHRVVDGRYWYVYRNRWEPLPRTYTAAISAWSVRVNPQAGMTGLVDRVLLAIEKKDDLADSTRAQYALAAREIKIAFADFAPDQVRQTDIAKFHDFHIDRPNMANRYLTLLRTIFDYAIRWGEATHNPAIGVKRHKEKARTRYLTDSEYAAIREAASPWLSACMDLLYLTAQRISDVLAIRMSDITEEGIRFEQEKTGARVLVAMTPELQAVIVEARAVRGLMLSHYLFHPRSKSTPYSYKAAQDAFRRACAKAGVRDATIHDIRAKSLTDADQEGKNAQQLAGHSSPSMTKRYLRLRQTKVVEGPRMLRRTACAEADDT